MEAAHVFQLNLGFLLEVVGSSQALTPDGPAFEGVGGKTLGTCHRFSQPVNERMEKRRRERTYRLAATSSWVRGEETHVRCLYS